MKRFYVIGLLCVLSLFCLFTACDDDDPIRWPDGSEVSALYESKTTSLPGSNKLILHYSGRELMGKGVYFKTDDGNTATLALHNIILQEKEVLLPAIALQHTDSQYLFSGMATTSAGTTFAYEGSVQPGVMTLNLSNVNIPGCRSFEGVWNLAPVDVNKYTFPLQLVWKTDTTLDVLNFVIPLANSVIGSLLPSVIKDITFNQDGNITALYTPLEDGDLNKIMNSGPIVRPDDAWRTSPLNLVSFYVKDNQLYVIPQVEMIMREVEMNATKTKAGEGILDNMDMLMSVLDKVMTWGSEGIPLNIRVDKTGNTVLYLDKEQIETFFPVLRILLPQLKNLLPPDVLNGLIGGIIDSLLKEVDIALDGHTTEMEIGIILEGNK